MEHLASRLHRMKGGGMELIYGLPHNVLIRLTTSQRRRGGVVAALRAVRAKADGKDNVAASWLAVAGALAREQERDT